MLFFKTSDSEQVSFRSAETEGKLGQNQPKASETHKSASLKKYIQWKVAEQACSLQKYPHSHLGAFLYKYCNCSADFHCCAQLHLKEEVIEKYLEMRSIFGQDAISRMLYLRCVRVSLLICMCLCG